MKKILVGAWLAAMSMSHVGLAREEALPEPVEARERGGQPVEEAVSGHREDRVYLSLSAGLSPEYEVLTSSGRRGTTTGVGSQSSLAIGYHLTPKLMLGGLVSGSTLLASNYHADPDAEAPPEELDPSRRDILFAGPYLHWHPSLGSGWYWQLAAGAAQLDTASLSGRYTALGGGMSFGLGYEWFQGNGFYLGALAATQFSVMRGIDDEGNEWWHTHSAAGSLNVTAAYN